MVRKSFKKPFMGLIMGKSHDYYTDIIKSIYSEYATNNFTWKDITSKYPNINRSILMRLKESEWIVTTKADHETGTRHYRYWSLHPNAMDIIIASDIKLHNKLK